ncbi:hypothetical protein EST38_g8610 [Candolleomyces aberdarensis]|uniref:MoaB/Mog domain-containing protein n=1 Tax=Candolleomyces aberdarensis TaxID=2316362 RepID=A0A4Q2DDV1_9AGAR|nr:hypothetical protein EST38_g8610 [Candolleomyces aberdarensis]
MSSLPLRAAVLTVSDTAAQDNSADQSGPTIRQSLSDRNVVIGENDHTIVGDDVEAIRGVIRDWTGREGDLKVDWIITTGGTGFGVRDVTPEAIAPLITRQAPGLVHLLISASLKHTPLAALSRPVAGTVGNTLITTLPGSVKAVKENLDALFTAGVIEHAVDLALRLIDENLESLPVETRLVDHTLRDYILAEDIYAPQDAPSAATTNVDGYALRSTDPAGVYKVVTSSTHKISDPLPAGTIYRINTGAPLPAGTDTVIMVEDTKLVSTYSKAEAGSRSELIDEEKEVETLAQIPAGENIRQPGSDVRKGDLVMKQGEKLSAGGGEVGTLAFVGRTEVSVYKKPVVAILSTGNELVDLQRPQPADNREQWAGIYDTNRPSLRAALEGLGYSVVDLGIVDDSIDSHVNALQKGLDEADLIVTTGGTSMGPADLLKPVIERNFHGTVHFGRVAIKPGKPTTFATIPVPSSSGDGFGYKPVFALPGNPASALVTFYVFVLPALRQLAGWPERSRCLPRVRVQLQSPMSCDPRLEFHRSVIKVQPSTGVLEAWSTGGQRSSRVASLQGANGLVVVPPLTKDSQKNKLEKGEWAEAILVGELQVA